MGLTGFDPDHDMVSMTGLTWLKSIVSLLLKSYGLGHAWKVVCNRDRSVRL